MKNIISSIILATSILCVSNTSFAQDYDVRLRLQGKLAEPGFGISGVVEVPALSTSSNVLVGVGVGHNSKYVELSLHLGGQTLPNEKATSLLDARGTFTITNDLFSWVNLRLQTLEDLNKMSAYGFAMIDYKLSLLNLSNMAVGVETENKLLMSRTPNTSDYSLGPNMVFLITKKVRLETVFQFHSDVDRQAWARINILL